MDESVKQIIPFIIAIVVGALLLVFVNGTYKTKVEEKLSSEIDKIGEVTSTPAGGGE